MYGFTYSMLQFVTILAHTDPFSCLNIILCKPLLALTNISELDET